MGEMDLSELDAIPKDLANRLSAFWQRVYQFFRQLREAERGG